MREIPLSNGMLAFVSECDFEYVSQFKWHASAANMYRGYRHNPKWYAYRMIELPRVDGKRKRRKIYLHREIMNCPEGMVVDHFPEANGLNCTRENMRVATYAENAETKETVTW